MKAGKGREFPAFGLFEEFISNRLASCGFGFEAR